MVDDSYRVPMKEERMVTPNTKFIMPMFLRSASGRCARCLQPGRRLGVLTAMPRFLLHLHNGLGLVADEEGSDLPDLVSARAKAIRGIRSIVSEEVLHGMVSLNGRIEIADTDGRILSVVRFDEAVVVQTQPIT